ncbi:MAG: MBOAT family protein [Lachnospiraceae bacterium]|nr:MBOAT family protein [Candidatus Colinaster scatohippi]
MLFPSEEFLFAFLPIVLIVYFGLLRRSVMLKNIWLFIASLAFYAYGEPKYVFLMVIVIAINYLMGLLMQKTTVVTGRKIILLMTIVVNVGILGWFKYASFIIGEMNRIAKTAVSLPMEIVLPIGISFFTFQAMSYVFDIYKGDVVAEKNPLYVGLYVSLFPQLIAGPIVRYTTVADQIQHRKENMDLFSEGVIRFLKGLVKKVIIANNMAVVADAVWGLIIGDRLEASVALAWIGAISYTLQILFDFSGYSDMAIGLGRMFGFKFEENFNYPYIADCVTDFWRRWHISLSSWFRDYVYIPLGGSKRGIARTVLNLFVVWLLTGIWHGANWTFVVWGLMYFIVLVIEKLLGIRPGKNKFIGHIYTLFVVTLGWVLFRSESLKDAGIYIRGMFGIGSPSVIDSAAIAYLKQNIIYYLLAIVGCVPIPRFVTQHIPKKGIMCILYNGMYMLVLGVAVIVAISFIINKAYNPFIYFNF